MQPKSKYSTGIRFGIITGLVYAILLFIRYNYFASNPLRFIIFAASSYLVVLALYLVAAIVRKKELNGYADFRDIFTTIFITILITEFVFVLFTFIYLKYVDPAFWENFKASARTFYENAGFSEQKIEQQMKGLDDSGKQMTPGNQAKGYGIWIIIDSIIGMIYAAILRKKKDIFPEPKL